MGYSYGYGFGHTWKRKKRAGAVAPPAVGGGALLVGETNGFATDFLYATDAQRVALKTSGSTVAYAINDFYQNAGTSPKQVYDVAGVLGWSPHNMVVQSQTLQTTWTFTNCTAPSNTNLLPNTTSGAHRVLMPSVTHITGETYTYSALVSANGYSKIGLQAGGVTGDMAFDISAGTVLTATSGYTGTITAQGGGQYLITTTYVAAAGTFGINLYVLPDSYTTGVITGAWVPDGVKSINIHRQQINRGTTPTAYLPTTTAVRYGLALDYDPVTHAARGLLVEPAATNLLLNSTTLSTQSVTVTAVAHTLSFLGTGTITLTGVSTAGPLVGTGASNRVSLTFTPTAGSLTCTVSGTVSNAQLETGSAVTSPIPTTTATVTRAADGVSFLLSTIPVLGTEYSIYGRISTPVVNSTRYPFVLSDGTSAEYAGGSVNNAIQFQVVDNSATQANAIVGTLVANVPTSYAARIKLNDFALSVAGSAVGVDNTITLPTMTKVAFGGSPAVSVALAIFRIEKLVIVTDRGWSNTELQTKSAT